jgi:hypothetical protein
MTVEEMSQKYNGNMSFPNTSYENLIRDFNLYTRSFDDASATNKFVEDNTPVGKSAIGICFPCSGEKGMVQFSYTNREDGTSAWIYHRSCKETDYTDCAFAIGHYRIDFRAFAAGIPVVLLGYCLIIYPTSRYATIKGDFHNNLNDE